MLGQIKSKKRKKRKKKTCVPLCNYKIVLWGRVYPAKLVTISSASQEISHLLWNQKIITTFTSAAGPSPEPDKSNSTLQPYLLKTI
jgi:hypothetical protein